jgi:hypothetical protein
MAMTEREILASVFGEHAIDRLVGHAPYDLVDSSDVLTPINRGGRCALSELAQGSRFADVGNTPTTEPVVRRIVKMEPGWLSHANDVARAIRDVVIANDGGRFRTPGGVEMFLDSPVDVSEGFVTWVRGRKG